MPPPASTPARGKAAKDPSTPAPSSSAAKPKMSPSLRKKLEQVDSLGTSPFPDYARPTPEECERVLRALEAGHGGPRERPEKIEYRANGGGSNCGLVPDVLDALVRTILSQVRRPLSSPC